MNLRWMRLGMFSFLLLTAAFAVNLLMFQPLDGRKTAKRGAPQTLPVAENEKSEVATGSVVILNAKPEINAKSEAAASATKATESPDTVRAVQRELQARGYETGTADGMPGLVTRAAIMAYQADHGLTLTGSASDTLLQHILMGAAAGTSKKPGAPAVEAVQMIRTVQQSLAALGYQPGNVDGHMGDQTVRALREFEVDQGLPETGRISGQLVARLARLAGQGQLADGR